MHPAVFASVERQASSVKRRPSSVQPPDARRQTPDVPIVIEIPLLFETGAASQFDRVVLVDASRETLLERLATLRGLDRETASRFLDAQARADDVRQFSDFVIENNGTLAQLSAAAAEVWRKLGQLA